jgi:hypothetical protein
MRTRKKSPVKTYGTPATAAPLCPLANQFRVPGRGSGRQPGRGDDYDQPGELIEARGREVQRRLLQDHLDLRAIREQEALPADRDRRRVEGRGRAERGRCAQRVPVPCTSEVLLVLSVDGKVISSLS